MTSSAIAWPLLIAALTSAGTRVDRLDLRIFFAITHLPSWKDIEQRVLSAEGNHLVVVGKRSFNSVGVFPDALVRADDISELCLLAGVEAFLRGLRGLAGGGFDLWGASRITDVTRA